MDSGPSFTTRVSGTSPLDVVRLLRAGGGSLLAQALLHGQLAHVEWQEEKRRLLQLVAITLLGFAGLLCALLSAGALVAALAWETSYYLHALAGLALLYGAGAALAWRRFQAIAASGDDAFAASRAELGADVALLRTNL